VQVWNVATGRLVETLQGHEHPLRTVTVSPDNNTIAAAGEDIRIGLWDAASGRLRQFLSGHIGPVNSVVFSPDSRILASGSDDRQVILWNLATGQEPQVLLGHTDGITQVVFSPDGTTLASASRDTTIRIWDLQTRQQRQVLQGHIQPVLAIAFSPDGTTLVSGGADNLTIVWNLQTGQQQQVLQEGTQPVSAVAFNQGGQTLLSAGEDNVIVRSNPVTGESVREPARRARALRPDVITALTFSPDGRTAAVAGRDGRIILRDPNTGQVRQTLQRPPGPTTNLPQPRALATARFADPGPGGPILVITTTRSPFSQYYTEILRNEGFNAFSTADITSVSATTLANVDVAILTQMTLTNAQATVLRNWVNGGGRLIAMRPDRRLANLLGLTATTAQPLSDQYLLVNSAAIPGIVNETIQFHGAADRYTLSGATSLATLYSNATTATNNPAVTLRQVGTNGGQAAAFTYDLARSIIYTRQGNPAWAGQERDGFPPVRSDDQYFGAASFDPQRDWVDLSKVAIPQADEQQRLLTNLVLRMNLTRKPLPRFWYFPRNEKAVVVMTGDDHAVGGTAERFQQYRNFSPAGCDPDHWECIRGTSYIYTDTPLSNDQAATATAEGFEVALHLNTRGTNPDGSTFDRCGNYTLATITADFNDQLPPWRSKYSSLPGPLTNRTHCLVWSNWAEQAKAELNNGIRLDTTYYYWPGSWVNDRPGFFTGSGMGMRFADVDGTPIDVYQAATQMTDESAQTFPATIETLLDRAIGPTGYYGAFVVNAHTDENSDQPFGGRTNSSKAVSDAVVNAALTRSVPVISARQLLSWLDGRNSSSFGSLTWNGTNLSFTITPGDGATGLQAMLPLRSTNNSVTSITRDGTAIAFVPETIKGIEYALFPAAAGAYVATYAADTTPPTVSSTDPVNGATNVNANVNVRATFNEAIDPATVNPNTFVLRGPNNAIVPSTISYEAATRTAILRPDAALATATIYTAQIVGGTSDPRIKDLAGNALAATVSWSFTTVAPPTCPCSIWNDSVVPAIPIVADPNEVELGVKFRSEINGFITGIRFYKENTNTETHIATLWTNTGQELASAPFTFTNTTPSGWQQVTFANPVAITANTIYVASYHAPQGNYAVTNDAFANAGVSTPPLQVLRDGESNGNGVYRYGPRAFPSDTFRSSNYWVDVIFQP
jgi:WD40 repeat protein